MLIDVIFHISRARCTREVVRHVSGRPYEYAPVEVVVSQITGHVQYVAVLIDFFRIQASPAPLLSYTTTPMSGKYLLPHSW